MTDAPIPEEPVAVTPLIWVGQGNGALEYNTGVVIPLWEPSDIEEAAACVATGEAVVFRSWEWANLLLTRLGATDEHRDRVIGDAKMGLIR